MLQLIKRCPEYTLGYKEYCQELYDNKIVFLDLQIQIALTTVGFYAQNLGMTRKKKD